MLNYQLLFYGYKSNYTYLFYIKINQATKSINRLWSKVLNYVRKARNITLLNS